MNSEVKLECRDNPLFVNTLVKAYSVLQAFDCGRQYLGLSELVKLTGMNKSSVQRFTYTWEQLGLLQKSPVTKAYRLTPKCLDLGFRHLRSEPLVEIATPRLADASHRLGVNVNLSVMDDTDIIYLLRFPSEKQTLNAMLPGRRVPAYCSSGGRMLMSFLGDEAVDALLNRSKLAPITRYTIYEQAQIKAQIAQARENGFAICDQECLLGEIAISVPIFNLANEAVANLHVALSSTDWSEERIKSELVNELIAIARTITPPC
ncbi:IclR family transcriptional regulator [Oceanimonas smirnovii]|uniref:IclR family transcriptional regulator n=1 Tax=Oceanimonas smirnovii TaxID=264574 RepID=A0ABW7NYJ4_9GAMM